MSQVPPRDSSAKIPAPAVVVLSVVCAQALVLAAAVAWILVEFVVAPPESPPTAAFLALLAVLALVLWIAIAIGLLRRSPRSRGAAVFAQLLMIAVGVGSIQGPDAQPLVAAALVLPAITAGLIAFLSAGLARWLRIEVSSGR